MILRQPFEQSRSFLNRVGLVPALETSYCGVQSSAVPKSVDSAELTHYLGVNLDDLIRS